MYSCHHCDVSCENRTHFNRHMRNHMTTDVKFLETQETGVEHSRCVKAKSYLEKDFVKELPEKAKLEVTQIETCLNNSVGVGIEKDDGGLPSALSESSAEVTSSMSSSMSENDMEDDLEETDFMYDENEYESDLPSAAKGSAAEIEKTSLENNMEYDLEDSDFIDDEDDYVTYDYDQPSKEETETDNNSKCVDISQILKKYSNVIASKPEPKAEQAGLKIDLKSNTHILNSAVKVNNKFTVEQENLSAEIVKKQLQNKTKTFPCDKCEKQYSTNWSLKQHYLKHTGEKPHKCEMCGELFALKKDLNKHMKYHSGI